MLAQVIEETDELDELGNDPWDDAWFEGDRWSPETYEEDLIFSSAVNTNASRISQLRPSQFTEFAFRMPREFKEVENETEEEWEARIKALEDAKQDLNFAPFSFEERPYMRRIYDTPARRVLLMCARQVEKSTLLGNIALCYMSLVPSFKLLYVNSSATQAKTFSNDRVKEPIETSPVLKKFTTQMLSSNILEKQFVNRSKITMRYAFLNADRTRGIPATGLEIDEFQDVLASNIPVIEQCTAHANPRHKRFWYAGTPKSLDNNIEKYWADRSTQNQWVVPHDCKGGEGGRHWNILGEGNIGKRSLVCNNVKCKQPIHPMADGATWGSQQKMTIDKATGKPVGRVQFDGYRIPQLMVPWKPWSEIVNDYETYPRDKFYNEVLGISFDSGLRPLTRAHIQSNCNDDVRMSDVEKYRSLAYGQPVWAGLDWGCHDEETRILTKDGFKFFRDLTDDDLVAQWDPGTRAMTFVKPKARTVRAWDQPLLHFKTKAGLDLMVTHTHRMRTTVANRHQWVTESAGETAERGGNINFVGHVDWTGAEEESFTLPPLEKSPGFSGAGVCEFKMDDWLELLGYLITEGGLCRDGARYSCLKMSQRRSVNEETYQKIQSCLERMRVPFKAFPNEKTTDVNWTIYGKQFWQWYQMNVGVTSSEKRIPRQFLSLSKRQLRILFDALVAGDGYLDERDGCTGGAFYSTSKKLCEDFQELCIRLGLRCIVRQHKPAEGNRAERWRAMFSEGGDYYFGTPSEKVERVPYKGKVYCCAVDSGYIVTERNGCISYQGNTGENTYTVITLATYIGMKFRVFYWHRFEGEENDPPIQLAKICELIEYFNVAMIGADYGGGFDRNDHLTRKFGPDRLMKFQYMARAQKKVALNTKLGRYQVARTEVMSDIFNAIKRANCFEFPRWAELEKPHAEDMLNIFSEYNEKIRMIQYTHNYDNTDDSFHSLLYCFLASMRHRPRPDIIIPRREVNGRPVPMSFGPIDQG